jgi:hypothetical protein
MSVVSVSSKRERGKSGRGKRVSKIVCALLHTQSTENTSVALARSLLAAAATAVDMRLPVARSAIRRMILDTNVDFNVDGFSSGLVIAKNMSALVAQSATRRRILNSNVKIIADRAPNGKPTARNMSGTFAVYAIALTILNTLANIARGIGTGWTI